MGPTHDELMAELRTARQRLEAAWSAETSAAGTVDDVRPSSGQSEASALYLQAILDGYVLCCAVDGVTHYWNRLEDGREFDLTRDEFTVWLPGEARTVDRLELLELLGPAERYRALLENLHNLPEGPKPCGSCPYCHGIPMEEYLLVSRRCWETLWVDPGRGLE